MIVDYPYFVSANAFDIINQLLLSTFKYVNFGDSSSNLADYLKGYKQCTVCKKVFLFNDQFHLVRSEYHINPELVCIC